MMNELKEYDTQAPLEELHYSSAQIIAAKTISTDQVKKSKYRQRVHRLLFRFSRREYILDENKQLLLDLVRETETERREKNDS